MRSFAPAYVLSYQYTHCEMGSYVNVLLQRVYAIQVFSSLKRYAGLITLLKRQSGQRSPLVNEMIGAQS